MKKIAWLFILIIVAAGVFFTPLLPTSLYVKYGPVHLNQESLRRHFTEMEIESILYAVRHHDKFMSSFQNSEPGHLSLFDLVRYRIGILSIEPCTSRLNRPYNAYLARVRTGIGCGGWCGGGQIFQVIHAGGELKVELAGYWVE